MPSENLNPRPACPAEPRRNAPEGNARPDQNEPNLNASATPTRPATTINHITNHYYCYHPHSTSQEPPNADLEAAPAQVPEPAPVAQPAPAIPVQVPSQPGPLGEGPARVASQPPPTYEQVIAGDTWSPWEPIEVLSPIRPNRSRRLSPRCPSLEPRRPTRSPTLDCRRAPSHSSDDSHRFNRNARYPSSCSSDDSDRFRRRSPETCPREYYRPSRECVARRSPSSPPAHRRPCCLSRDGDCLQSPPRRVCLAETPPRPANSESLGYRWRLCDDGTYLEVSPSNEPNLPAGSYRFTPLHQGQFLSPAELQLQQEGDDSDSSTLGSQPPSLETIPGLSSGISSGSAEEPTAEACPTPPGDLNLPRERAHSFSTELSRVWLSIGIRKVKEEIRKSFFFYINHFVHLYPFCPTRLLWDYFSSYIIGNLSFSSDDEVRDAWKFAFGTDPFEHIEGLKASIVGDRSEKSDTDEN